MLTRIIVGSLLALLAAGVFYGDQVIGPPYPFLMAVTLIFGIVAANELVSLIPSVRQPSRLIVLPSTVVLLLLNWTAAHKSIEPWLLQVAGLVTVIGAALVVEMSTYREPGESVNRVAVIIFAVAYLAILAAFFVQLRLQQYSAKWGTLALLLAVFVPKGCDIGAYFTGSFIGKHKMTPILSPKKSWEGAAGGLLTAIAIALGVQAYHPIIPGGWAGSISFGLVVGAVGMIGDLAESLIKRDSGSKDAANLIPGFGGVLDVIDSVLFAAPVVYLWLRIGSHTA